jgi:hypothetical protein
MVARLLRLIRNGFLMFTKKNKNRAYVALFLFWVFYKKMMKLNNNAMHSIHQRQYFGAYKNNRLATIAQQRALPPCAPKV